jgi:SAM-dependent methyltransferase
MNVHSFYRYPARGSRENAVLIAGDKMVCAVQKSSVCPWWCRFALFTPLRKALNDPQSFLAPWVKPGMVVADIGCGTGFITLPLSRLVGNKGKVIAVDLQTRMLEATRYAARREGLGSRIRFQQAKLDTLGALPRLDGAVTAWMLHEVPDKERLLHEIFTALRPGGVYLFFEPILHVTQKQFADESLLIEKLGFVREAHPSIALSHAILYRKRA